MIFSLAFFVFGFETAHLIFAVKYWSLSLRVVQMINKEVVTRWQKIKVPLTFWLIFLLIVLCSSYTISTGFLVLKKFDLDFDTSTPKKIY